MKRILTSLFAFIVSITLFAQAPNVFNYQGLARDLAGNPITNKNIGLRVSILQGSPTGGEVYKETQQISTNNLGLFNIQIGRGTPVYGEMASISWGMGIYHLKIEMDENGGSNYQHIGTSQLLSVPYALYAEKSGSTFRLSSPSVTATNATNLNLNSATLNGIVNGNGFKTDVLFEWGTTTEYGNSVKAIQDPVFGSENTRVSVTLTGLQSYTNYFYRIKVSNAVNTVLSNGVSFNTGLSIPTVNTGEITMITTNTAKSGGDIISDGGATITARGVCWNKTGEPIVTDDKTTDGNGTGIFTSNISGLEPNMKYYVRAYATNSAGTGYGEQMSFTTEQVSSFAAVTTSDITQITFNSAIVGGNVINTGGSNVTERGVVYGTSTNPTISNEKVTLGNGTGSFSKTISELSTNTTYYVRAYAVNGSGISYGNEVNFTLYMNVPGPSLTDVDGNTYKSVRIGSQIWMAENLKTSKYRNGESIQIVKDGDGQQWWNFTTGAYFNYQDIPNNSITFGKLYNWFAVADIRGLCPVGWHCTTDAEWQTLADYLGGIKVAAGKLKHSGTAFWNSPNTGATNESGFTALPGGSRETWGYVNMGVIGNWWMAPEPNVYTYFMRHMHFESTELERSSSWNTSGYSVRCIKD